MLDSYSAEAQRVVSLAMAEARGLGHGRVGTEHLLLGLLSDNTGTPAELLRTAGAGLAAARHKVAEVAGPGAASSRADELPLTARAQRALDRGARFARQDRAPEALSGHLLLGVLDVEGLACQVLRGLGVDVVQLRAAVIAAGAASGTDESDVDQSDVDRTAVDRTAVDRSAVDRSAVDRPAPSIAPERPRCPRCRASLDETLAQMPLPARGVDATSVVDVVYCTACGTTMGVLRRAR